MSVLRNGVDFEDTHVVVTGAAAGIGRKIAIEFGALNAAVSIVDLSKNPRDEESATHERITEAGGQAEFFQCDLRDAGEIERTISNIRDESGEIDVLVNNAGINRLGSIEEISVEDWDAVQAVNARGAVLMTKFSLDSLRTTGGCIVNVASIAGMKGSAEYATYAPSKATVLNHTKQVAVDYGSEGIRANAVAPGIIEAGMGKDELSDPDKAEVKRQKTILDRLGTEVDVANAVLFLASDAAGFITGETLVVDGGWTT
ncbi:SDR family NAD(P)-dependent oxidoreductase [Natrinema halophilum]|uniref:SDR family oxidoreductase n=1 Tax=Natrinema halophilum TaxID=1699371 RepID=A0A7D5GGS3_9EURY|nr:SDR family oxidoreductase [Natrinema halophilum]QLG48494.1 SDR family oxidoreductase [Natrinema halophilum]